MAPFTEKESVWIADYWLDYSRQRRGGLYAAVLVLPEALAQLPASQTQHEARIAALTYRLLNGEQQAAEWLLTLK